MTAQTTKPVALGVAGVALAAGVGFGITQLLPSDGAGIVPAEQRVTIPEGARDSWEGRITPAPVPGTEHGVRDSWMPPGTTDQGKADR